MSNDQHDTIEQVQAEIDALGKRIPTADSTAALEQVQAEIDELGKRFRGLVETPAEGATPSQPSPHEVLAAKLRDAQGTWLTIGA
jgi:hypothetical protein